MDAGSLLEDSADRSSFTITEVKTADTIIQFFLEGDQDPVFPLKKVAAIFRLDTKDFIDLYFLLERRGVALDDLIPIAKQKLVGFHEFDLAACLAQFPSLAGRARFVERYMIERVDLLGVEKFYRRLSRDLFERYPPPTVC